VSEAKAMTGAADWRSDAEKDKSLLRTAALSLFKTWIPEHPEASAERDQAYGLFKQAMGGRASITFVSSLSSGVDDVVAHGFAEEPLSMQELLVQREGTDAFLDPRNALRVVRRKYGMMTLITRLTGALEHRNVVALSIEGAIERAELMELARLVSARVVDSSAEEEQTLRRALARANLKNVEFIFHADIIGRRLPVGWPVKHVFALVGRALRAPHGDPGLAARGALVRHLPRLDSKALRQVALYSRELSSELDAPMGLDLGSELLQKADEATLLQATRALFDAFQTERRNAQRQRALDQSDAPDVTLISAEATDFVSEAELAEEAGAQTETDELVRTARALDRIRTLRGRDFFARISMLGGELDFEGAARSGQGFDRVERTLATLDPADALRSARRVLEPLFRARALAAAAATLARLDRRDEAQSAAAEALAAARECTEADAHGAFAAAIEASLSAQDETTAEAAVTEGAARAHGVREPAERAAALMRLTSTLIESGALPASTRAALSRSALGPDIHFWGRREVEAPLVEGLIALLPAEDDDTQLFLQKVVAHPSATVRAGVVRTMPLSETPALRNMLLAHLRDRDPDVRIEVVERLGASGDRALVLYLVNACKHVQGDGPQSPPTPATREEKRALLLNLTRLDGERQLPLVNAFLGALHTEGPGLTDRQKPLKDDVDLQLAALEVLVHLRSRGARRLIFNAAERARRVGSPIAETFAAVWGVLKAAPYGDAHLPRSPHDPAWTEADRFELDTWLEGQRAEAAPAAAQPTGAVSERVDEPLTPPRPAPLRASPQAVPDAPEKPGLFERLKRKFLGDSPAEPANSPRSDAPPGPEVETSLPPAPAAETEPPAPTSPPTPVYPATLLIEAHIEGGLESGASTLAFECALYATSSEQTPLWRDTVLARCAGPRVVLELGRSIPLPAPLPASVWLDLSQKGHEAAAARIQLSRARSVVHG
jgi:hypothetical protein